MANKIRRPSKDMVELIASKFKTPDEFVTMYNAFIMGRLKDKDSELEDWFNRIDEDKLDEASNYYLTNERLKKFTHDLHSIKRKCKTKEQREMFNRLLAEFGMGSEGKTQIEVPKEISDESVVKSFCQTKSQRKAFNELVKSFKNENISNRKLFSDIKSKCLTKDQRKAFNKMLKTFMEGEDKFVIVDSDTCEKVAGPSTTELMHKKLSELENSNPNKAYKVISVLDYKKSIDSNK